MSTLAQSSQSMFTKEQVNEMIGMILSHLSSDPEKAPPEITQPVLPNERLTVNVAEMAEMVGISKPTAYALIREGKIRSLKIGRKVVVSRQAVMDFITAGGNV